MITLFEFEIFQTLLLENISTDEVKHSIFSGSY